MRVFISFEGKKSRHMENLSHCLYVDTKKMFTVFDFLVHVKRKYALKEHYYLYLSLDNYFIADNENIKVLHDSDKLTVRISKMNVTPKCFRNDNNLLSEEMDTVDSCVTLNNSQVDETLRNENTNKPKDDRNESENFVEAGRDQQLPLKKDRILETAVLEKRIETQPSRKSVDLFLPRKFQLKPVAPRAKLNLGSLALSSSSLNSRKDRLERSVAYSDRKSSHSYLEVDRDQSVNIGQTQAFQKQKFIKAKETEIPATDSATPKTSHATTSLKPREIKKGHIRFDSDEDGTNEVMETSPIVDYSPIVKPIYKEPPPLENSEFVEPTDSSRKKDTTKISKSSTAEANARRGAMVDKILDAYNKKMDSILEELGTQEGSGPESDDEADDESTSSEDEARPQSKKTDAPKSGQLLTNNDVSETQEPRLPRKDETGGTENAETDNQNCEPASGSKTNDRPNEQTNDLQRTLRSSRIKTTPGLNIFSVVSQLNRELKEIKSSEPETAVQSVGLQNCVPGIPNEKVSVDTEKICSPNQNENSNDVERQSGGNDLGDKREVDVDRPQESLEDILKRSKEHISKNKDYQNLITTNHSAKNSTLSGESESSKKRKADHDSGPVDKNASKTNGPTNGDVSVNGSKKQRIDISDDENEESAADDDDAEEIADSSFSHGKPDSTDNQSVREVKFSIASSSSKGSLNVSNSSMQHPKKQFGVPSLSSGGLAPIRPGSSTYIPIQNGQNGVPKIDTQKPTSRPASVNSVFQSSLNSKDSSSSSEETSEDEAAIKACVKKTSYTKTAPAFGAVWTPKVSASAPKVTQVSSSNSSRNVISDYPKAKPAQSWCEKEPQANTSQVFESPSCSADNVPTAVAVESPQTDKPSSTANLKDFRNELFRPNNVLSFNVLDLDENFRPDIVSRCGTVIAVDKENKTIKVKVARNEQPDEFNLSKRATILHEGLAISSGEVEENSSVPNSGWEEREFKIEDLFDVKVVEAAEAF